MQEQISSVQKLINTAIEFLVNYSFQIVGALLVLVIGAFLAGWLSGLVMKACAKKNMDVTLSKFFASVVRLIILAFAVIIAVGKFGITITPFIAALGAASFGASLALQGPLSNYGAGLGIILSRPFVVGDTISVAGASGMVHEVKLGATTLFDGDGVKITIPNHKISGEIMHNSGKNKVAMAVVGIGYESNPETAVQVIRKTLDQFKEVVKTPAAQVGISEFADSAINITYRYWAPSTQYGPTVHAVNLAVFNALKSANIQIPYPQREVRVLSGAPAG